jgi:isopentenyl-diphosphate delta-isomerase
MSELTRRKDHHIDIVRGEPVAGFGPAAGFGRYTLEYDALPEVDLDEVDLSTTIFGKHLSAPLVIGAMTGGTDRTGGINRVLARGAARVGVGMALGSQRAMIRHPEVTSSFAVRDAAPDLPLLVGNVGAIQLNYGVTVEQVQQAIDGVGADAINFHLNPLQEAIQPEGDTRFRGVSQLIAETAPKLSVPVLIKEVGNGISARTARRLAELPIAGVEVAGTGGTSWAAVEAYRAGDDKRRAGAGIRLAGFGVPTIDSLQIVRDVVPDKVVVASGGVRSGMDVAVALALGADAVALAKPFLDAAEEGGEDAVAAAIEELLFDLRVICFCAGAKNLEELRQCRVIDVTKGYR